MTLSQEESHTQSSQPLASLTVVIHSNASIVATPHTVWIKFRSRTYSAMRKYLTGRQRQAEGLQLYRATGTETSLDHTN